MIINKLNTFSEFENSYNKIFTNTSQVNHFQILDIQKIKDSIKEQKCYACLFKQNIFLLISKWDFFDLLCFIGNEDFFYENLITLEKAIEADSKKTIRISAVGKINFESSDFYQSIKKAGFSLVKKISRYQNRKNKHKLDDILSLIENNSHNIGYASPDDAQKVQDFLLLYFDPIAHSVPELSEIKKNILKKQVVCAKDPDGNIISISYFEIINKIYYGLFDYTLPKYRQDMVYIGIILFLKKKFEEMHNCVTRSYYWCDTDNKKTNRFAKEVERTRDGVYIYNLIFNFDKK